MADIEKTASPIRLCIEAENGMDLQSALIGLSEFLAIFTATYTVVKGFHVDPFQERGRK